MTIGRYVQERRSALGLRAEQVGAAIGKSQSWVSRLETGAQKVFPEPEEIRALAEVLQVTVPDLLEAAGYLHPGERPQAVINPFPPDDIRHRVVEAFKRVDLSGPERAFWLGHFALELRMLRDIEHGLLDDVEGLGFSDHEQRSEGTVERNNIA